MYKNDYSLLAKCDGCSQDKLTQFESIEPICIGQATKLEISQNLVLTDLQGTQKIVIDKFFTTLIDALEKANGSLNISVYRMGTQTDRYLDFYSHCPKHVKNGSVK